MPEWQERFARLRRPSLLQSYDYARAVCPLNHQKARWGLIEIDGAEAGLVQILEAGIAGNLLHAIILDCGPCWFEGFGAPAHKEAFFGEFARQFPRRFGRRRRVIPDWEDGASAQAALEEVGYKRLDRPGYQTVWLDLRQDEQTLLAAMKPQWRNKLKKAANADLQAVWDEKGADLPFLLTNYQLDKATKGYEGPSMPLARALAMRFAGSGNLLIGKAVVNAQQDDRPVAALMILCHGRAATWQIGWNSDEGRTMAAQNFLVWRAALYLKDRGIEFFDLGGINDETAAGVRDFKKGTGGEISVLAGHYI